MARALPIDRGKPVRAESRTNGASASTGDAAPDRARERALLLWNLPLFVLAAWGVAAAQKEPSEFFVPALLSLVAVWAACLVLHALLCATRFDGDELILPLFSLLVLVGSAYHLDMQGQDTPG